jgi:general secretion pathway protein D
LVIAASCGSREKLLLSYFAAIHAVLAGSITRDDPESWNGGNMVRVGNPSRYQAIGRGVSTVVTLLCAVLLTSCYSATVATNDKTDIDVLDKVRSLDIFPRNPRQVSAFEPSGGQRLSPIVYNGTEVTDIPEARPQSTASGSGFDLNFENTPVATVAKVMLGDILGTGYIIDPRVQGTVSLVSVRPVPKSDIIFVLENALRLSGAVLLRDPGGYRLTPLGDAVGAGRVDSVAASPEPGYGVSVVPLQHVSAQTVLKLMDSFATKAGMVRADSTRNILLIQGSGAERRTAVDTVLSFDVDWMRGQSVGIYPIANSGPEPIITELEKILDSGDSGLSQNVIKFQAVSRLNAILVVSRKPALLRTAATWIKRLDNVDAGRNSVHVYRVKYGEARQIARLLTEMFIGGSSSTSIDIASNQIAPGSGLSSTFSPADRLSLISNSGSPPSNALGSRSSAGTAPIGTSGFGASQATPANASGSSPADAGSATAGAGGGKPVLQGVRITADSVNNTVLIYADQENYRIIASTLQQVDQPQLQVAIDATIAEVTLNDDLSYGVQFYLTSRNLGLRPDHGSALNTQSTAAPAAAAAGTIANAFINRAFPRFNFLIGSEAQPSAILDALHTVTGVKVLSTPSLVVVNNQVATLQVGDVVPVSTGTATVLTTSNTIVNTIDYRNTGVILRVSPRINVNGNVRLDVEQEISNVSAATAASLTPTVSERRVKSSISVATGQTVLLAGLISEQQNSDRNGIPLLDQIPGLGDAFSHQDKKNKRTELIIFIRPQIIRDSIDAHAVAEEIRSKLRGNIGADNGARTPGLH